jgi:hypothetical protein
VRRPIAYLWAAPVTAAALPLVALALVTGGRARRCSGVLEAWGGALRPLLTRANPVFPISAITFGHVVLGTSERVLEKCRAHERVHVRQYETWGALFPLLYLGASVAALARGRAVYAGNAFERQAFRESGDPSSA